MNPNLHREAQKCFRNFVFKWKKKRLWRVVTVLKNEMGIIYSNIYY